MLKPQDLSKTNLLFPSSEQDLGFPEAKTLSCHDGSLNNSGQRKAAQLGPMPQVIAKTFFSSPLLVGAMTRNDHLNRNALAMVYFIIDFLAFDDRR